MEERACINCGACNVCDLDESKTCDNCCKCLGDSDYSGLEIDDILINVEDVKKKLKRPTPKTD